MLNLFKKVKSMCKKVVFLVTAFRFPNNESKLNFERTVRNTILIQHKGEVCLEICHVAMNQQDLKNLTKKRLPNMVIFHECNDQVIENSLKTIKAITKKDFLVLVKERPGFKNNPIIGEKIEELKNIPLFLTAVPV